MDTQYIKQFDTFRCGPIAVLNVIKWLGLEYFHGRKVNKHLLQYISDLCKCDRKGSYLTDMQKVLEQIDGVKRVIYYIDARNIESTTLVQPNKRIALVKIHGWQGYGHIATLMYYNNPYYTTLNWYAGHKWYQIHYQDVHMVPDKVNTLIIVKE